MPAADVVELTVRGTIGSMIDVEHYRRRLQDLEAAERARADRTLAGSVMPRDDVNDSGDASVASVLTDESLTEAQMSAGTLAQIRAALDRIDAGTYGACVVDGEPIGKARLDAVPWTPYCREHAEAAERGNA